jgi:DNA-binding NtrC family response regulator
MVAQGTSTPVTVATTYSEVLAGVEGGTRVQLAVVEGPDQGRAAPLGDGPLVVGTAVDCGLVLRDERVSQRHLRVTRRAGRFLVEDLSSRNGTLYEGARITASEVGPGAVLKLGRTALRLEPRPEALELPPSQARRFGELVAESLVMRELFAVLERVAPSEASLLVEGETGTGKELVARAVHEESPRRRGAFVALDCGALPTGLVQSELFGHQRGAFTGALSARVGAFARAHQGTLFLDELAAVPAEVQAALLRALETRRVRPVGADEEREADVRVVAAAQGDLAARVAEGSFRPDLYYRLAVVRVRLPPLRQRREDLPLLVQELLRRRGLEAGEVRGPNLDRLMAHAWPGNVRELRNVLERALALSPGARSFAELSLSLGQSGAAAELALRTDLPFAEAKAELLQAFERRYLQDVLARAAGNQSEAARLAGMDRKHLRRLLVRCGLLEA